MSKEQRTRLELRGRGERKKKRSGGPSAIIAVLRYILAERAQPPVAMATRISISPGQSYKSEREGETEREGRGPAVSIRERLVGFQLRLLTRPRIAYECPLRERAAKKLDDKDFQLYSP